jgi:hypothetical protein
VVSHAFVETARIAFSRFATLADFTQSGPQTNPPVLPNKTEPSLAMARSARWYVAGSAEWNLRYASWLARRRLGTGVHLVSVCGHALRARNANWVSFGRVQTSGLSKRADRWR